MKMFFSNYKNMHLHCNNCKKHTGNTFPKNLILISKNKIKGKSNVTLVKIEGKYDIEIELEIYLQVFTDWFYKRNMETYHLKCRKIAKNSNSKIFKTKNRRLIMLSKCADCGIKKSWFVEEQEEKSLLSNLGIKTPLTKIPLLNILF